MSFNKNHFENEQIWIYSEFQKNINREKYKHITEALGTDFKSIIDIGCGNGHMLSMFEETGAQLYGADFSKTALKHVEKIGEPIYLDLMNPVFSDFGEYDLVGTFDVLEHLQAKALDNAISLIKSIACKYIVVNVPNDEDLELRRIKCKKCKTIFHPYGHISSFNEDNIVDMFTCDKIRHVKTIKLGPQKPYSNHCLSNISKCVFNGYMDIDTAHCPCCGGTDFLSTRSFYERIPNAINKIIGFSKNTEKEELMVFFEVL